MAKGYVAMWARALQRGMFLPVSAHLLRRYLAQDLASTLAAVIAGWLVSLWTHQAAILVAAVVVAENLTFYGLAWRRALREVRCPPDAAALQRGWQALRDLLVEYWPAEAVDLISRPALVYGGLLLGAGPVLGAVLGVCAADVLFYAIAWHSGPARARVKSLGMG